MQGRLFGRVAKAADHLCNKMHGTLQEFECAGNAASASGDIGMQRSALNLRIQAEIRFESTKLQHDTLKAWLAYCHRQAAAVSEMREPSKRRHTGEELWNIFLANMEPTWAHSLALCAYRDQKGKFDVLPVQARITKLRQMLMPYLKRTLALTIAAQKRNLVDLWEEILADGLESKLPAQQAACLSGLQKARIAAGMSASGNRPGKRPPTPLGGPGSKRQRVALARRQPESSTVYSAVPVHQHTALQCPDVGYQSNTESRPYSHSLRACLLAKRRCLVCWATDHSIWNCPRSSQALRGEME